MSHVLMGSPDWWADFQPVCTFCELLYSSPVSPSMHCVTSEFTGPGFLTVHKQVTVTLSSASNSL